MNKTPEELLALAKQCGAVVTPCNNGDATCDFYNRITFDEDDLPAFAAALTVGTPEQATAKLTAAVKKVHGAKGRHHNQIAMCDLYDIVGLPCVRPATT